MNRTTRSVLESLLPTGAPVPEEFICLACKTPDASTPEFAMWAAEHRPDLVGVVMPCDCKQKAIAAAEADQQRREEANLPARNATFANWQHDESSAEMWRTVEMWATHGPREYSCLTLVGVTGSGKSHLMEAAGRVMLDRGLNVRYERAGVLLDHLRATFDSSEEQSLHDRLDWYQSRAVLLLDDIGMHKQSDWGEGYITSLVEQRILDRAPLMVATNFVNADEMAASWGDRLASRLFDRHSGSVRVVVSEAPDYRLGTS